MKLALADCLVDKKNYSDICGVVKWICCQPRVERSDVHLCVGISELNFVGLLWYLAVFSHTPYLKDHSDYLCKLHLDLCLLCGPNSSNALSRCCGCHSVEKLWSLSCKFVFLCFRAWRAPYSYYQVTVSNDVPDYIDNTISSKSYMYKVLLDVCRGDGC